MYTNCMLQLESCSCLGNTLPFAIQIAGYWKVLVLLQTLSLSSLEAVGLGLKQKPVVR